MNQLEAFVFFLKRMDLQMIDEILSDDISYCGTTKAIFLEKLNDIFVYNLFLENEKLSVRWSETNTNCLEFFSWYPDDFENKFHTGILGENDELTEFTNEVKTELAGEKLKNISASIRDIIDKKEFNIQKLDELSQEFGDIVPTDALALEYKKVSLQLSQAEITFIVNRKELSSAKNSQKRYEALFENNKISNKEKKECADAILALLKAKLNKGKNNFSENLKLKQSIRYFEEKSEAFKA